MTVRLTANSSQHATAHPNAAHDLAAPIRLAIIGTNWITERFVRAAIESGAFCLTAVYSRQLVQAQHFADKFAPSLRCFTDLTQMAASDQFDAVYIASPNSLHYEQSVLMLSHHKHVICEKPLASNRRQVEHLFEVAKANNRVLFEAYKTPYTPGFLSIKQRLTTLGEIRRAYFNFCQYSSRYPRYLAGENPNTFNPAFSNGSIMDIGYYCVAAAVELFGAPETVNASAKLLPSGVDGHGSVVMHYPEFEVQISHSKVSNSYLGSEIQGELAALQIQSISEATGIVLKAKGIADQAVDVTQDDNDMRYEADYFAQQIHAGALCEAAKQRSLTVASLLDEIRAQTGVVFPADNQDLITL